jgi:hypothetical protein
MRILLALLLSVFLAGPAFGLSPQEQINDLDTRVTALEAAGGSVGSQMFDVNDVRVGTLIDVDKIVFSFAGRDAVLQMTRDYAIGVATGSISGLTAYGTPDCTGPVIGVFFNTPPSLISSGVFDTDGTLFIGDGVIQTISTGVSVARVRSDGTLDPDPGCVDLANNPTPLEGVINTGIVFKDVFVAPYSVKGSAPLQ